MLPFVVIACSLLCSWMVLHNAAPIGQRLGLIDRPNEARKIHTRATPRIGGIAFISTVLIMAALAALAGARLDPLWIAGGSLVLFHFGMGVVDDHHGIPARWRLVMSIVACFATFAFAPDLVVTTINLTSGVMIELPRGAAFIVTVLGTVGFIFSVNLMDGRNGILGVNAIWWFVLIQGATGILPWWGFAAILGTLILFLEFNLRGLLFAGDSGAYVIGASVCVLVLISRSHDASVLQADQVVVWFLLPVIDATRVFARRLWLRMGPFKADRSHLHHVLWDRAGDRHAAMLYAIAVFVPSGFATLVPELTTFALVGASSFFFVMIYWPVETVHIVQRIRR